jgi:hypothetical protein
VIAKRSLRAVRRHARRWTATYDLCIVSPCDLQVVEAFWLLPASASLGL